MSVVRHPPSPVSPPVDNPSDRDWADFLARVLETVLEGGEHDGPCANDLGLPCAHHLAADMARRDFARDALLGWAQRQGPVDLKELDSC